MGSYWPSHRTIIKSHHKLVALTTKIVTTHPTRPMLNPSITTYSVIILSLVVRHVQTLKHVANANLDFLPIHTIHSWLCIIANLVVMWLAAVCCVKLDNIANNANPSISMYLDSATHKQEISLAPLPSHGTRMALHRHKLSLQFNSHWFV